MGHRSEISAEHGARGAQLDRRWWPAVGAGDGRACASLYLGLRGTLLQSADTEATITLSLC
jgi:hypothetical protein